MRQREEGFALCSFQAAVADLVFVQQEEEEEEEEWDEGGFEDAVDG